MADDEYSGGHEMHITISLYAELRVRRAVGLMHFRFRCYLFPVA